MNLSAFNSSAFNGSSTLLLALALLGSGASISANASIDHAANSNVSGSATTSVDSTVTRYVTAELIGVATTSASPSIDHAAAASLVGSSALVLNEALIDHAGSGTANSSAQITASAVQTHATSADIVGTCNTFAAVGFRRVAAANLIVSGSARGYVERVIPATVILFGTASLQSIPSEKIGSSTGLCNASLNCEATLTQPAYSVSEGTAAVSIAAGGVVTRNVSQDGIVGTARVRVESSQQVGAGPTVHDTYSDIVTGAQITLVDPGTVTRFVVSSVVCSAHVLAEPTRIAHATAVLTGSGIFTIIDPDILKSADSNIVVSIVITASALVTRQANAILISTSQMTSEAIRNVLVGSVIISTAEAIITGTIFKAAEASLVISAVITAEITYTAVANAIIRATGIVYADTIANPESYDPDSRTFIRLADQAEFIRLADITEFRRAA